MKNQIEIKVSETQWLYDSVKPMTIQIFKLNYDFFFDLNQGYNNKDEKENLNEAGEQYILLNNSPTFKDKIGLPFFICLNIEDAKNYAEKTVGQKLNWKD